MNYYQAQLNDTTLHDDLEQSALGIFEFIKNYSEPFSISTPHLYISALPWLIVHKSSKLSQHFTNTVVPSDELLNTQSKGIPKVIQLDSAIFSVAGKGKGKRASTKRADGLLLSSSNSRSSTRVRRSGLFYLNPDPAHNRAQLHSAVVHLSDVTLDVGHLLVAWCTWDISKLDCGIERDTRDRTECTERKPSVLLQSRARRAVLDRAAARAMRTKGESHLGSGAPASPRCLMRVGVGNGFGPTLAKV